MKASSSSNSSFSERNLHYENRSGLPESEFPGSPLPKKRQHFIPRARYSVVGAVLRWADPPFRSNESGCQNISWYPFDAVRRKADTPHPRLYQILRNLSKKRKRICPVLTTFGRDFRAGCRIYGPSLHTPLAMSSIFLFLKGGIFPCNDAVSGYIHAEHPWMV